SAPLRKAPSIETSGACPQVQETRMERSEEVRPDVRILSFPPHCAAVEAPRSVERCTHCQYGNSSRCPASQATTKREGTRSASHVPQTLRPAGGLKSRCRCRSLQSGQECIRGKRRTRRPSLLVSSEAGGSRK